MEYSRHRLLKCGPATLKHYGVPPEKVVLVLGDYHHLRLPEYSIDFILMSEAFHHTDQPDTLLREVGRVLKPSGVVIIIGEEMMTLNWKRYVKQPVKYFVSRLLPYNTQRSLFGYTLRVRSFFPNEKYAIYENPELGDHIYTIEQYKKMFSDAGFKFLHYCDDAPYNSFVLIPS